MQDNHNVLQVKIGKTVRTFCQLIHIHDIQVEILSNTSRKYKYSKQTAVCKREIVLLYFCLDFTEANVLAPGRPMSSGLFIQISSNQSNLSAFNLFPSLDFRMFFWANPFYMGHLKSKGKTLHVSNQFPHPISICARLLVIDRFGPYLYQFINVLAS